MTTIVTVTVYAMLIYSYLVGFYDVLQFKGHDTDYSCHIKAVELV